MKFQESRLLPLLATLVIIFVFSLSFPRYSLATSGCCSSHGGVNCVAGPQANGNVICNDGWRGSSCSYVSMVMCAGYSPATIAPIMYTPQPTIKVVLTPQPTRVPTPTPTADFTPTSSPQVQGAVAESTPVPTPTPTVKPLTAGETAISLGVLAVVVGLPIWIIVKIIRKFRKSKLEI